MKKVKLGLKIVSLLLFAIFIGLLFYIKMIPVKYIIIASVVLIVLLVLIMLMMNSKKKAVGIIGMVLIVLMSAIFGTGIFYVNRTYKVINRVVDKDFNLSTYYVLVKSDSSYQKLKDLKNKNLGFMQESAEKLKDEIKITFNNRTFDSVGNLYYAFTDNSIDAMVIGSGIYDGLVDNNDSFEKSVKIIAKLYVKADKKQEHVDIDVAKPFIIYLAGEDNGNGVQEFTRNDANIIVVVNPYTHKILLVNTPRDYLLPLWNQKDKMDKLTHFGYYGINTSVSAMETLYGVKVDSYVRICYEAVVNLVDSVGGIDIYSDKTFVTSHEPRVRVKKGMNHFNGTKALAFSQERYAYESGDRHRGQNQQAVLSAVIKKISTNKAYLLKYPDIIESVSDYFVTNISMNDVQELIKSQLNTLASWDVESISVDGEGDMQYTYSIPKEKKYVMIPSETSVKKAKDKINAVLKDA